ncbi:membrane protein [Streptococcus pneumoniae]|nr:membrane protein [Streptococcus pneumoniae]
MKSLARLLIIHVFISIFLFFALTSGAISHTVLLLLLLFLPALNKGLEKIQSKRIPVLNAALFFLLIFLSTTFNQPCPMEIFNIPSRNHHFKFGLLL